VSPPSENIAGWFPFTQRFVTELSNSGSRKSDLNLLGTINAILEYAKRCGIRVLEIPAGSLTIAGDRDGAEAAREHLRGVSKQRAGQAVDILSNCVGSSKKPPARSREGARQTIASCTGRCGQVLTCFGARAKRFRGAGSSRASIRGGARCLFSGAGLAGFRLKQLDRRPVLILRVYDTHHGLVGTGIRVVE